MQPIVYLFFDTEFCNFNNLSPLSIGIISEDKDFSFYQEINDFKDEDCSQFVKDVVFPLMLSREEGKPYKEVCRALIEWINQLPFKEVLFAADYGGDIIILERMLSENVGVKVEKKVMLKLMNKAFIQMTMERGIYDHHRIHLAFKKMVDEIGKSLSRNPQLQHHAMYDAEANRDGWYAAMKLLYS